MSNILILCGKTASGKNAIKQELIKRGFGSIVTYTSRPKRLGEKDGVDYHFLDNDTFLRLKSEDCFMETTSYNVANGETWYYGSAYTDYLADITNTTIILNPSGINQLKDIKAVIFYIKADGSVLWERLSKRGDSIYEALRRLIADNIDFSDIEKKADYTIYNNGDKSIEEVTDEIIKLYKKKLKCCGSCKFHDNFSGVCFNGYSDRRADFTDCDERCEEWRYKIERI